MFKRSITALIATSVMTATAANYCFPSANPPGGKSANDADLKQIVTFIWDDNAYSGKSGTNYEGPSTQQFQFQTNNWINGYRSEGGWVTTDNKNELKLSEGMIGMSWAAHTLAGHKIYPYKLWDMAAPYSPQVPDTVLYNDSIWACTDWPISTGEETVTVTTSEGTDTTVTIKSYNPPRFLDTTSGTYTITKQEIDPATGLWIDVEKQVSWSELEQWDKAAILEQYKAWTFVGETDKSLARKNPDGSEIKFTFNVISGLMTPTFPIDWQARESKFGYYVPNDAFYPDGYSPANRHSKIAVSWGREMPIYESSAQQKVFTEGYITQAFKEAMDRGHEIGNHTIDHMESNSPLPVKYYEEWNSDKATNGFDYSLLDTMPWGDVINEAEEFGQKEGNVWQTMGWKMYAGKYIAKETWKGAIELSESEIKEYLGISRESGEVSAFRAPRLEVNSAMFYALKELGYTYDCGLEEGYEYNVDGTNFLWPYTTDNGSPNVSWQRSIGETMSIDSMPAGFWQIPVNTMIVPQELRDQVWANHATISAAEGEIMTDDDKNHWVQNSGKVTGFDFNMFILWGMTKKTALKTLKYNLDQRMLGGKAPMQVGCHTDYFTPIYDYATLANDVNKDTYGLCLQWNDWKSRQETFEEFIDYATETKGAYVYTGKQTIDYVKSLMAEEKMGKDETSLSSAEWNSYKSLDATSFTTDQATGNINASVTIGAQVDSTYPFPGFEYFPDDASVFDGLTHISFDYKITAPVKLKLHTESNGTFEVWLNSLNNTVHSGKIPLYAFHRDQYSADEEGTIDPSTITGMQFEIITSGEKSVTETISISNIVLNTGDLVVGTNHVPAKTVSKTAIALNGMSNNSLKLSVPASGNYSVQVVGLNGRIVGQFDNAMLNEGVNNLALNNLSSGVYLVKVAGFGTQQVLKSIIK